MFDPNGQTTFHRTDSTVQQGEHSAAQDSSATRVPRCRQHLQPDQLTAAPDDTLSGLYHPDRLPGQPGFDTPTDFLVPDRRLFVPSCANIFRQGQTSAKIDLRLLRAAQVAPRTLATVTPEKTCTETSMLAVEHAMRCTTDISSVIAIRDAKPETPAAYMALGRLVASSPVTLKPGTPLATYCQGGIVDTAWRDWVSPVDMSIWGELDMLRSLYQTATSSLCTDLVDELLHLRDHETDELS